MTPLQSESPEEFIARFLRARATQLEELIYDAVGLPKPVDSANGQT
jgi:hypothetical protein